MRKINNSLICILGFFTMSFINIDKTQNENSCNSFLSADSILLSKIVLSEYVEYLLDELINLDDNNSNDSNFVIMSVFENMDTSCYIYLSLTDAKSFERLYHYTTLIKNEDNHQILYGFYIYKNKYVFIFIDEETSNKEFIFRSNKLRIKNCLKILDPNKKIRPIFYDPFILGYSIKGKIIERVL